MIRFICFLLGREYEPCKSCETLREELEIQRILYQNLTNTLINVVNPQQVQIPIQVPVPDPIIKESWNTKRKKLEEQARESAKILKQNIESIKSAKPEIAELIEKHEVELGLNNDKESQEALQVHAGEEGQSSN